MKQVLLTNMALHAAMFTHLTSRPAPQEKQDAVEGYIDQVVDQMENQEPGILLHDVKTTGHVYRNRKPVDLFVPEISTISGDGRSARSHTREQSRKNAGSYWKNGRLRNK